LTDDDKISTEPGVDALAGAADATDAAAAPAATAPATATGTSDVPVATTGPSTAAISLRLRCHRTCLDTAAGQPPAPWVLAALTRTERSSAMISRPFRKGHGHSVSCGQAGKRYVR
jgi:hypothetical protein